MITEKQIIEAAKACAIWKDCLDFYVASDEELTKFAQHWYRQGLLDAAEKCDQIGKPYTALTTAEFCGEALRQMADEMRTTEDSSVDRETK